MNFNLFSVIAASAVSATVALPAAASVDVTGKKSSSQCLYPEIPATKCQLLCRPGSQKPVTRVDRAPHPNAKPLKRNLARSSGLAFVHQWQ
jgi:hypothetical protein